MRFYRRSSVVGVYIRKPFWFRLNWVVAPKSFWVSTFSWLDRCSRYLLYSDLTNCLTDLRNSLNFRLRISDGWAFSFLHNPFFFFILLKISLVILGGFVFFFTVKVGMHISAAASNKSLTLSVEMSTSSSKKVQFPGIYFNNSFNVEIKVNLFKVVIFPWNGLTTATR